MGAVVEAVEGEEVAMAASEVVVEAVEEEVPLAAPEAVVPQVVTV